MADLERRRRRLERSRNLVRIEFAFAVAAPLVVGFLIIAAPGGPSPMFMRPSLVASVLPWAGVVAYVVGIAWMVRICRADPDAGESPWRYRDF
jgi:cation transporter-like permease